jgi:hypothetical protein
METVRSLPFLCAAVACFAFGQTQALASTTWRPPNRKIPQRQRCGISLPPRLRLTNSPRRRRWRASGNRSKGGGDLDAD